MSGKIIYQSTSDPLTGSRGAQASGNVFHSENLAFSRRPTDQLRTLCHPSHVDANLVIAS